MFEDLVKMQIGKKETFKKKVYKMHTDSDAGLRPPILNSQDVLPF